jgi:restriction system protein
MSPRKSKRQLEDDALMMLGAGVIAVLVTAAVVRWLVEHWWVLLLLVAVASAGAVLWWRQREQRLARERATLRLLRLQLAQLDALRHDQFEFAIRDLMRRDGATAERKGGRGDNGCDVLAVDPAGRRWVIQCKHRRAGVAGSAIGTPDLQTLNGTARPIHKADVVVLVTNGRFTRTARPWGQQQRIHLVDRELLGRWASGPRPLWELLGTIPPPRRATPLS